MVMRRENMDKAMELLRGMVVGESDGGLTKQGLKKFTVRCSRDYGIDEKKAKELFVSWFRRGGGKGSRSTERELCSRASTTTTATTSTSPSHAADDRGKGGIKSESERVGEIQAVKSKVLGSLDPIPCTVGWVRYMAENPWSVLLDSRDDDRDVRTAKMALHRLRCFRQEGLLQRRAGLRPASMHSLNLVPVPMYSPHQGLVAMEKEEHYPPRSSRVGELYQADMPSLRGRRDKGGQGGEREEPTRVWPVRELFGGGGAASAGGARGGVDEEGTKRIVALLTDPVDYRWSDAEYKSFKEAHEKFGKDFRRISRFIKKAVPGSGKTSKDCSAFYFQVYVGVRTLPGGKAETGEET
ncbi:SANT domain-containing protein [Chloropicon primus]|uniref:SANT domain-containing protein n=1 Tax=Chloropicon primus TaxID=1764295 RepID=A0A5B8MEY4_9CHLO|nr:hypothetical protein A3770_02p15410 [Chloropicon primus]UPQ98232.1 SANT domain-containing protein [Chloropicon primus]|eukprot:QDZ19023.1 hypothetical protein A3770_02p15410 [Chloropicon primus]